MPTKKKVLVALSGGVDSSLCCQLLKEQGFEVGAVVLRLSPCHDTAVQLAQVAAQQMGIELFVCDELEMFDKLVVDPFCQQYLSGLTPNPCVVCNPTVKFKLLCQVADREGYPYIATGHYARVETVGDTPVMLRGSEEKKDQSYMLYRLGVDVLKRLIMPLGALTKAQVRQKAAQAGLYSANTPDSQEICFLPDGGYPEFVENRFGPSKQGYFIDPNGRQVAKHKGIAHYTVGQRKRLGIALGQPVFIKEINADTGEIHLAYAGGVDMKTIEINNPCFSPLWPKNPVVHCSAKIRSQATPATCTVTARGERYIVEFERAQSAPAPGQSAVFYDGERLLGGGIITK